MGGDLSKLYAKRDVLQTDVVRFMLLHMSGVGYVCLSCLESRNNAKCCAEWGIEMFGMCEDGLVRKKFELSVCSLRMWIRDWS